MDGVLGIAWVCVAGYLAVYGGWLWRRFGPRLRAGAIRHKHGNGIGG